MASTRPASSLDGSPTSLKPMWRTPAASASSTMARASGTVRSCRVSIRMNRHVISAALANGSSNLDPQDFDRRRREQDFAEGVEQLAGLFARPETPAPELIELVKILQLKLELERGSRDPPRERNQEASVEPV